MYRTQRERALEELLAAKDAEIALLKRRLAIYEPLLALPDEEHTPFDRNNEVPVRPHVFCSSHVYPNPEVLSFS